MKARNSELSADAIKRGLSTSVIAREVYFHTSLDSTMDEALRLAKSGANEGTLVVADTQTAGHGRFNRTWLSEPGASLLISIVTDPTVEQLPSLNMGVSLAVIKAVEIYPG